jgi:hypothetical protein
MPCPYSREERRKKRGGRIVLAPELSAILVLCFRAAAGTYIPIFFKIVLSSLISKGMEKSNMTSVRSRLMSH